MRNKVNSESGHSHAPSEGTFNAGPFPSTDRSQVVETAQQIAQQVLDSYMADARSKYLARTVQELARQLEQVTEERDRFKALVERWEWDTGKGGKWVLASEQESIQRARVADIRLRDAESMARQLEQVEADRDWWCVKQTEAMERAKRVEAERDRYREALEHYAEELHWSLDALTHDPANTAGYESWTYDGGEEKPWKIADAALHPKDLAPCGMHGEVCPAMYQPWGSAGETRMMADPDRQKVLDHQNSVWTGSAPSLSPRWKRELRLLRRDGLRKYLRGAWLLHCFHRSVRRLDG